MKRFIIFLFVLLVATAAFGFSRGWFDASTANASGKPGLVFSWDKSKFKSDLSAAGSKLKAMSVAAIDKIKGKAKAVSSTESELEGKVTAIDAANHQVTIDVGGQPIELTVPDTTGIEQLQGKVVHVKLEKDGETFLVREIAEKK